MGIDTEKSFSFTENRVEEALRLLASGKATADREGRRLWRDSGSRHGLYLRASRAGAAYYRIHKVAGKKLKVRIGDATAMSVSKAREIALKLAGGNREAAPAPIRVRTDGPTVAQVWSAYIKAAESGDFVAGRKAIAASTARSYRQLFEPHLKKQFGGKSLHHLAKQLPELHKSLRSKPVTANRLLQVVRNVFTFAARNKQWDQANPAIDTITGRGLRKYSVNARARYLTTNEAGRIMAYSATAGEPWCDFWPLMILTGVRASTLREMKWANLDLREDADSTWAIAKTKNGEPMILPLTPRAVAILRERWERAPRHKAPAKNRSGKDTRKPASAWVFPMKGEPTRCISDLDNAWRRVCEKTGIEGVRIHDLRRTVGSWATQAGSPLPAVGMLLGHRSLNATAVYARSDVAAARQAAEAVEKRLHEAHEIEKSRNSDAEKQRRKTPTSRDAEPVSVHDEPPN